MIKIENVETYGWESAIRGMRNPMNSWDESDSLIFALGENDLELMKSLVKAGTDHSKFMRMINVTLDITARCIGGKSSTHTRSVQSVTVAVQCTR